MEEFDLDRYLRASMRVDLMDRTMAELPGMDGSAIFRHARAEALGRAASIPGRAPGMWTAVPA
jgi:hypothetical protein